ncbi:MAG: efflux RND transporter permease subunit, partial [Opitutaceae bacterium]
MNIPEPFIRRPVMTTLVTAAVTLFGWMAYTKLPVSDLPNVDFPTISVSASLPGASPETMAASVATPLEQQFSSIAGIDSMTSVSTLGSTSISLQFNLDRNIDAAAQDVQTAIAQAQRQLPTGMPSAPSLRKVNPAEQPILFLVLTSSVLPLSDVNRIAEQQIAQRISMINGVAQVAIFGAQKYAVRIAMQPQQLAARQLGVNDVVAAVQAANATIPAGSLFTPQRTYALRDSGRLQEAADFADVIVAYREGAAMRLADVAVVRDSVVNERLASRFNGRRSIVLAVQRQPGSNTVAVNERILALLPELRQRIPAAVSVEVLFDRSESIRAAIDDVQQSLLQSVLLVMAVVVLFLGFSRTALIPGVAIAVSLVGTFAVMALLGFSLDNLSLMALTLSVGFVVDDAVVMVETIARKQEEGLGRRQAALEGAREIGPTIVSMTLSLTAVFLPILLMGGLLGRLFREFAITLSVAILFSGLVGLTLTPMLSARFQGRSSELRGPLAAFQRQFERLTEAYRRSLAAALGQPAP